MHVFQGSPSQTKLRLRLHTLAFLLLALTLAGCNAPPPQPNPQPTYAPRDTTRHERRDRDRDNPRDGSSSANNSYNGDGENRSDREDRYREHDRYGNENRDDRNHNNQGRENQNSARQSNHRAANNTPGQFDFYLLNLSWAPEFCYNHADAPECTAHSAFVLHGLWPQNNDGTYPENCSETPGPTDPNRYTGLYPNPGLLQHEWRTHGTCTGLTPDAYLAAAGHATHEIIIPPTLAHLSAATSMPPNQILNLFQQANPGLPTASLALSCGHNFLTAVGVCMDKNLHPTACQQVRSCGANTVRIPAP